MGDEILDLIIRLGIEVDEKGNIKTANKNLKEIEQLLKKIGGSKGGNLGQLNKQNISLNPDKQIIADLKEKIKLQDKWLQQLREQKKLLSSPNFEKTGVTDEEIKNANIVNSPIKIPSSAKLIETQTFFDGEGKKTVIKKYQEVVKKDGKTLVNTFKEINGVVTQETNKLNNSGIKANSFDKFIARVKNIVVYRLVREVMSAVSKSITEGFNLISVNNSSVKNMLTEFKASSVSLSISLSTMLLPIMERLSSLLNTIGMQFIDVANEMSRQNAIAKGQATYYKINKDAVNDYAKSLTQLSGNLSQLDKFATLSGKNTPILGGNVDIAEQSGITEESQQKLKLFQKVLKGIGDIIIYVKDNFDEIVKSLGTFIALLISAKLVIGIGNLVKGFGDILNFIKNIKLQSIGLIAGVSLLAIAFSSDLPIAIKVLAGALGGLITVLSIVFALKEGLSKGAWAIASLSAVVAGIGAFAVGMNNLADSGSSAISSNLSSATNISSLMGSVASSGSYSQSATLTNNKTTVSGDVYLDKYKVGKILTQDVYTNGTKSGYFATR